MKITHSFLQGSLARRTMVPPLKDVDMVVTLDCDEYVHLLEEPLGPNKAMDLLQHALREVPSTEVSQPKVWGSERPTLFPIELGDAYPSFDLVPAFETTTDDDDVLIADREDQRWERSNTREQIRVVADANKASGGTMIHVVRMVGTAVRTKLHEKFPGLAIESISIPACGKSMSYAEASARVFEMGATMLGGPILDPTGRDDLPRRLSTRSSLTPPSRQRSGSRIDGPRRCVPGSLLSPEIMINRLLGGTGSSAHHSVAYQGVSRNRRYGAHLWLLGSSPESRMATIGLTDVLANPASVAEALQAMDCVDSAAVSARSGDTVSIRVVLLPHDPTGIFIAQGYPVETVQVVVRSDRENPAVPKIGERSELEAPKLREWRSAGLVPVGSA